MFRITPALGTLMLCLWLTGCASIGGHWDKPDVRLADVQMLKGNLWEQQFRVRLRVDNPNPRALPIRGMQYQIHLNDARLATGVSDRHFNVPAYGSEYFDIEVRSNLWRHIGDLIRLVDQQQPIEYRVDGHIRTGLWMAPRLNLEQRGTLNPDNLRLR
ncbi:MAG: LEA type 2 family protein [Halopseudomonas yangmingensis]|uniref:LEA14-like dessication related protein n=1 Tax=Halopseudomonas yangmingensis TaxID=1720063 RepID=A0A1I4N4E6_9GAMM|nr:LEA type 2 family protein [Halopseudomonas yangmingensis]SFM10381.1 LEA14-like dessication related protein [Halopseudomonas yangmingensis]